MLLQSKGRIHSNFKKRQVIIRMLRSPAMRCAMLTVALLAPFLNKAFHIDDPIYLWVAQHIQAHPLDYYGFNVNWSGLTTTVAEENKNPPLVSYFMALAACITGWNEIGLHLAFLIPAVALTLGVYTVAKRLCDHPAFAATLSVLSPVFLVSATNLMTDVLMAAFYVWAVAMWLNASESNRRTAYVLPCILIVAAALSKYFAISLIPLLAAYSLASKRNARLWAPTLGIALVLLGLYEWHSHARYGAGAFTDAIFYTPPDEAASGKPLLQRTLIALSFSGGCIAVLLFLSPLLLSRTRLAIASIAALAVFGMLAVLPIGKALLGNVSPWYYWPALAQLALWIAVGLLILALAAMDFAQRRDAHSLLLVLWLLGTFVFVAYLNWSVTARTVLPMVAPAAILAVRRIEATRPWFTNSAWNWRTVVPLFVAAVLSLSVVRAAYLLSNSAREAAGSCARQLASYPKTVYFLGHWGFQYYMQEAGKKHIELDKANLEVGDIVISPFNNTNVFPLLEDRVQTTAFVDFPVCRWVTPVFTGLGAGFYSDLWGPLPFAFGPVPPERYRTSLIGKPGNPFDPSLWK